jgi:3-methyladenine DNA glycosylase AlkD
MTVRRIREELQTLGSKEDAAFLQRFFKTGPGEYGEGDVFLGVRVPQVRKLVKQYPDAGLKEARQLLTSPIHEERLLALLILVRDFTRGNDSVKKRIYEFYLAKTRYINNWDLVDSSAEHIVGAFLKRKDKAPLHKLARSDKLWERRIAIMATFHFIKQMTFSETLKISKILLQDEHDLIHKAVGWMLREIGKRDMRTEEEFLKGCYGRMPRTMLRYAIEKFPEPKRQAYLKGKI